MAPLSIFVIVPFGLLYRWSADGARFELTNSLHWIVALATTLSLPALFMTLVAGVPLYLVALRRNIVSIWLPAMIGFVCPWIYYLGRSDYSQLTHGDICLSAECRRFLAGGKAG